MICILWKLLIRAGGWEERLGRGEGWVGKRANHLVGIDSLYQTKPNYLGIGPLGQDRFQVSSDRIKGKMRE